MAHIYVCVGDFVVTVQENTPLPEERKAAEEQGIAELGDHVVTCWEHGTAERASIRLGEADAVTLVGAWCTLESDVEHPGARELVERHFGKWAMP